MRVLHFVETFSRLSQTFIFDYIRELDRQGSDSHVLTLKRENEQERPYSKVHIVELPPRWNRQRTWRKFKLTVTGRRNTPLDIWWLRRIGISRSIRKLRPTVIHAHFGQMGVRIAPLARRHRIPLVVTFYGYDASGVPRDPAWFVRYQDLWPQASAVVVLSERMKERVLELGCPASKVHIVRIGKRLEEYPFRLPSRPVRHLISVGRLVEKKGHLDLIDAVGQLHAEGVDLEVSIIGEGPLRGLLEERIRAHGLEGRVTLLGAMAHAQVIQHMRAADAFVLTSKTAENGDQEGTPTVLLEAQAMGLPCVSTWHAGIPEQIPEGSHWLLAAEGDVPGIADRIRALARCGIDELEALAVAGRRQVESMYEIGDRARQLSDLYRQVSRAP